MPRAADRFSRLAALKPARQPPARVDRPQLRPPDQEDLLAQFLGAGVAANHFGEYLAIRNWYSTPEYAEPSRVTLELLSRDKSDSRKTRATLEDPSRWLFLDTETTGLAGGTGTYAFLIGLAWWDGGDYRSSSSLCGTSPKNIRFSKNLRSASQSGRCFLRLMGNRLTGRCSKTVLQ